MLKRIVKLIDFLLLKFIVLILICKNCRIIVKIWFKTNMIRSFKNFLYIIYKLIDFFLLKKFGTIFLVVKYFVIDYCYW